MIQNLERDRLIEGFKGGGKVCFYASMNDPLAWVKLNEERGISLKGYPGVGEG